jgi:Fe-S cluster assembly iron-binding protein IscA
MLQLTTDATKHLRDASERRDAMGGQIPRFARQSGQIKLGFASTPEPGDKVVETSGMRLLVAEGIADKLDAAIIDIRREQDGDEVLVLRRQKDSSQEGTKAANV